jgi:hypothetical protein
MGRDRQVPAATALSAVHVRKVQVAMAQAVSATGGPAPKVTVAQGLLGLLIVLPARLVLEASATVARAPKVTVAPGLPVLPTAAPVLPAVSLIVDRVRRAQVLPGSALGAVPSPPLRLSP